MKKRILIVLFILVVLIDIVFTYIKSNLESKEESFKSNINDNILSNSEEFFDPEYNLEYITNINEINIENKDIESKYQFVYISDLQASIIDENEEDEQIKNSLEQRYSEFASLNSNNVRSSRNF